MTTLTDMESLAKGFGETHESLAAAVRRLNDEVEAAQSRALPEIKLLVRETKRRKAKLEAAIEANPALFAKPKTQQAHGVRFGLKKEKGKVTFANAAMVIELIKRHRPRPLSLLVKTTETPIKDALSKLPGDMLKKLGVTVGQDSDRPYIKLTDSEVEKLVAALLAEKPEETP